MKHKVLALVVVATLLPVGSAHAQTQTIQTTSFPEFNRASCAVNRMLGMDPLSRWMQCSPPLPAITKGAANATDEVHDDGSFAIHDLASGGSALEYWYAVSSVIYEVPLTIDHAVRSAEVTMSWRMDKIFAQGSGTGDLSAYGTAMIYTQPPASSGPPQVCQGGGALQSSGQTAGMHFYDNLAPGLYQVHVNYSCSDGSEINSGQLFGAELVLIGYVASRDANGSGESDIVGQLQSVTWGLQG